MEYKIKDLLTIVIPCKNEENYIFNTLSSIAHQKSINGTRVIIADAGSKDRTLHKIEIAKSAYRKEIKIEVIQGGMPSVARNAGAKISTTSYVLFLDADSVLFEEDNIAENISRMVKEDLDLLGCRVGNYSKSWKADIAFAIFNFFNSVFSYVNPFCVGGYFMTKRTKFKELGGFDENVAVCEDYLLSKNYSSKKFRISKYYYGQDDRRFRKYGYFKMVWLMAVTLLNKNNPDYFKSDLGYWK